MEKHPIRPIHTPMQACSIERACVCKHELRHTCEVSQCLRKNQIALCSIQTQLVNLKDVLVLNQNLSEINGSQICQIYIFFYFLT